MFQCRSLSIGYWTYRITYFFSAFRSYIRQHKRWQRGLVWLCKHQFISIRELFPIPGLHLFVQHQHQSLGSRICLQTIKVFKQSSHQSRRHIIIFGSMAWIPFRLLHVFLNGIHCDEFWERTRNDFQTKWIVYAFMLKCTVQLDLLCCIENLYDRWHGMVIDTIHFIWCGEMVVSIRYGSYVWIHFVCTISVVWYDFEEIVATNQV